MLLDSPPIFGILTPGTFVWKLLFHTLLKLFVDSVHLSKHSHRDLQRLCVWEGFLGFLQFYPAKQSCVYWNYLIPAKLMRCDIDIALYYILGGKKLQKDKKFLKFASYWAFEWEDLSKVKRYKFFFMPSPNFYLFSFS